MDVVLFAPTALSILDGELLELIGLLCDLLEVRLHSTSHGQATDEDHPGDARRFTQEGPQGHLVLGSIV